MFKERKNRGDDTVQDRSQRFEESVLPHIDAAFNLARWLTRSEHDAEDVVQESYLRAHKFFDGFRGGDGRAWLLSIVRNTCYTWLRQNRPTALTSSIEDEELEIESQAPGPEAEMIRNADSRLIDEALEELPIEFREALILREMEGLSYKEIADIAGVPIGTVMSRLARARKRLQNSLTRDLSRKA